ncbi:MAG: gamma-carboxygeranoyl-CoA hydratase, partial [Pseudomonadales bacterium]|nr:gamma-carboxygeranoyl-CoA hydratase [Pseudomonadales bacterium]
VADSLITTLLQNSPQALKACKKLIQDVDGAINSPLRDMTTTLIAELRASPEGKEGLSAFLEKRPAGWLSQ